MKTIFIIIPLLAGVIAQSIKLLIGRKNQKIASFKDLFSYGGMPSAHSAIVAGLAAVTLMADGPGSPTFLISFIFYIIVVRDAIGYRRQIGYHAERLNKISAELKINIPKLNERIGHTVQEVFWGTILGFFTSLILLYLFNQISHPIIPN